MQVFVPYKHPFLVAQYLDSRRLNKQIIECKQIIDAINGVGKGWFNHPVTKMYSPHKEWLEHYKNCLESYRDGKNCSTNETIGYMLCSTIENDKANRITPPFLTDEFCDQHKRRLYTKDKEFYKDFAEYGESDENWYVIDGEIVKYKNGKKL